MVKTWMCLVLVRELTQLFYELELSIISISLQWVSVVKDKPIIAPVTLSQNMTPVGNTLNFEFHAKIYPRVVSSQSTLLAVDYLQKVTWNNQITHAWAKTMWHLVRSHPTSRYCYTLDQPWEIKMYPEIGCHCSMFIE